MGKDEKGQEAGMEWVTGGDIPLQDLNISPCSIHFSSPNEWGGKVTIISELVSIIFSLLGRHAQQHRGRWLPFISYCCCNSRATDANSVV